MPMPDKNHKIFHDKHALSPKLHWDKVVGGVKLPRIYESQQFNIRHFDLLFKKFFHRDAKKFFEAGCGSSAWLPYIKKYYGLSVSGLDYSEIGCEIADNNLEYFDRKSDECIFCADVTSLNEGEFGFYDIVFSYGLIEHFEFPDEIVFSLKKLVAHEGQIVTIVPNLQGLNGFISRIFMPKIFAMHKVISDTYLRQVHEVNGFRTEFCGYVGVFYPYVIPWSNSEISIMKLPIMRKIFLKIIDSLSRLIIFTIDKLSIKMSAKFFAPYVVYIGHR
jgi:2-polyprenyl-3-methyl-5-hydroxy-6-metoxy-1,4-benzoquinol methylase